MKPCLCKTQCSECGAGYYSANGSLTCTECPAGKFVQRVIRTAFVLLVDTLEALRIKPQYVIVNFVAGKYLSDPGTDANLLKNVSQCIACDNGKRQLLVRQAVLEKVRMSATNTNIQNVQIKANANEAKASTNEVFLRNLQSNDTSLLLQNTSKRSKQSITVFECAIYECNIECPFSQSSC